MNLVGTVVEYLATNQGVVGSNPAGRAKIPFYIKRLPMPWQALVV